MEAYGLRETFAKTVALQLAHVLSDEALIGLPSGAPVAFERTPNGFVAQVMMPVDRGRWLSFVFFLDTLENFTTTGLVGQFPARGKGALLAADIDRRIETAYQAAQNEPDFRECLTVIVGCGLGRALVDMTPDRKRANWRSVSISVSDLFELTLLDDFEALSLWRLLEAEDRLRETGVALQNANGLLNLIAWARSLKGHLVPHAQLPDSFGDGEGNTFISIQQNSLRTLRHEAVVRADRHSAKDQSGRWVGLRRDGKSLFEEDRNLPFYAAVEGDRELRWIRGVYESEARSWWFEYETTEDTTGHFAYERFKLLRTWLCRMVPKLEEAFPNLPPGPIVWRLNFKARIGDEDRAGKGMPRQLSYEESEGAISIEAKAGDSTVALNVGEAFEEAFFHPENIAERSLVARSIDGFAIAAGVQLNGDERSALLWSIVQSPSARQSHKFAARSFRDFVRASVWDSPIIIDDDDTALLKLGLGWRARERAEGRDIRGKSDCINFLNATVRVLEDETCSILEQLDRRSVLTFCLQNHEAAIADRDAWRRTAAAVLALHDDKEATLRTMSEHDSDLSAVFLASRLIIEMAQGACPVSGGRLPGTLEMSRMMARVLEIAILGGWSDAIRWDAMEPTIRVTPLGDIHGELTFFEDVMAPYVRAGNDLTIDKHVKDYAKNLEEREVIESGRGTLESEFLEAVEEELGAPFQIIRELIDKIENAGLKHNRAIFSMNRSELYALCDHPALIDLLTFTGRDGWRNVPDGFNEKDLFPWRYRRRLSILRRPLIQIDDAADPTLLVAPGVVRDSFAYMIGNFHRGDYPLWQLKPKMRKWAGKSRDRIGHAFAEKVANRLRELGWHAETEVRVTKLLRKGFEQDYGDVDVLAWRENSPRVLAIECKDVQHRKTSGEVAEQLADFLGEVGADGKPDHLLRHLKRVDVIASHSRDVAHFIGREDSICIEGHLVFKNPVPMKFAWTRIAGRASLHLYSELSEL
jgi:hypothetical protein